MRRRIRVLLLLLVVGVLCWLGLRWLQRLPGQFSNELVTDLYNCTLTLTPAAGAPAESTVRLTLEWEGWRDCTQVLISPAWLQVISTVHGREQRSERVPSGVQPGSEYHLTVMRRGEWLGLLHDGVLIYHGQMPHPPGVKAAIVAEKTWTVEEASIEKLEPVVFADNFMRTAEAQGNWTTVSGAWKLQSAWDNDPRGNSDRFTNNMYAQNPFSWVGHATTAPAVCTTGRASWEDYTLSVSVQPRDGAVGALVNLSDPQNGLLVRWSAANDHTPDGGQVMLYKLVGGKRTVLARSPGGYLPGQWYRLAVVSALQGVRVLIDGQERLAVPNLLPWRGGIGLYAEGKHGAVFDDLTAYGRTLNVDLIDETQQFRLSQRILDDKEMQKWAKDWEPIPGGYCHQRSFFGDHRLIVHVTPEKGMGELTMLLNGDGADFSRGYRAVVARGFDGKASYTIFRDGKRLATEKGHPMNDDEEYTLRFWHEGDRLWLEQDGVTVASARDSHGLTGTRAAYSVNGSFAKEHSAVVIGRNVLDYQFTDAPVDWVPEGNWAPSVRWACDARWSFLGGWSHGDAVLWHKQRFTGDQSFEVYVAPLMEYPRARVRYGERYCGMGLAICGDGHDPRSGYAAIYGAPDEQGNLNKRTVLLRRGVVVASINLFLPPKDEVHKQWSHLELKKAGNAVEFWVDGKRELEFTDPQPIDGGVPGIWTTDNGLSVARARLYFANPPQPRTDTQLTLDAPAYPEWCNVGSAVALNFPNACASSGNPVRLQVTPRGVPAGEGAPAVNALRVTLAPRKVGTHWYEVTATDGITRSPGVHFLFPAFNPALRRDDSHAVVLYHFDEGQGRRVHDRGHGGTPADILIPSGAATRWQSGQGLSLLKPIMLKTAGNVRKLNAIAQQHAGSIECWLSYATLYPPTKDPIFWEGNVVSWENLTGQRNFSFGFHSFNLEIAAIAGADLQKFNPATCWTPYNHLGLQHQVVAWDGHYTYFYVNGKLVDTRHYKWQVELWQPDMPLTFGNEPNGLRPFLGTYYLLAIHDCTLSANQVLRHYQAGPSAR